MSEYGYINTAQRIQGVRDFETSITLGEVIDTNDPMQMGRLRVYCAGYGDSAELPVTSLPWASYASPFGGVNDAGSRGRGDDETTGPVAYGMWNIPKVGSHVLVGCIDGDPSMRFWFASIFPNFLTHTLPHGRYFDTDKTGPLSSTEDPIQPLNANQETAFGSRASSFEWQTRGADKQASFLNREFVNIPQQSEVSEKADDRTQGYAQSRVEPDLTNSMTDGINWDPQTYSWTTPGFHAISMEDRKDNCRIRFRTTGGHQIIMDDTNERIYIGTAQGKTWVEIDEKGNVDIYAAETFSVKADGDINFTAGKTIRMTAQEGIHLNSAGEARVTAAAEAHVQGATVRVKSTADMFVESGANMNIKAGAEGRISSSGIMYLKADSQIIAQGPAGIHLNGPGATPADPAATKLSFATNRVPAHESWARVYMNMGADPTSPGTSATQNPEYPYSSDQVGRGSAARGISFDRNPLWKR